MKFYNRETISEYTNLKLEYKNKYIILEDVYYLDNIRSIKYRLSTLISIPIQKIDIILIYSKENSESILDDYILISTIDIQSNYLLIRTV